MAEKRTMVIEVQLDLSTATNQMRSFVAANNRVTVPTVNPVGATVPTGFAGSGVRPGGDATAQAAVSAALAQAEAASAPYVAAMGPGGVIPLGTASPNWSYLMASQNAAQTYAVGNNPMLGGSPSAVGSRGGFSYMGFRTAVPIYAALEVAKFGQGMARTNLDVSMAGSDTEAFAARAQNPFGDSLVGRVLSEVADVGTLYSSSFSPSNLQASARVESARRSRLESAQSSLYARQQGDRMRTVEATGTGFDVQRERGDQQFEKAYRAAEAAEREARRHLGGHAYRMFGAFDTNWFEYDEPDAGARQGYATEASSAVADKEAAVRNRNASRAQIDREEAADVRDQASGVERARMSASHASDRALERFDLNRSYRRRLASLSPGDSAGRMRLYEEAGFARQAQDQGWSDADRRDVAGYGLGAQISNLMTAGNFTAAKSLQILQRAGQDVNGRMREGSLSWEMLGAIGQQALADLGQNQMQAWHQQGAFNRQLTTMASVGVAQWNRDPLGAQLAQIEGARQEALANPVIKESADPNAMRARINANFDLQAGLAGRNQANHRADLTLRLTGATDRAQLGIDGGPTRFFRQGLSSIVEQTDLDVRSMEDESDFGNAARRRNLGGLQLRAAESEFYRSIDYREASPRGVYGTGTLGGVRGAVADAQAAVAGAGRGAAGNATGGSAPTKDQMDRALDTLHRMLQALESGVVGVAG